MSFLKIGNVIDGVYDRRMTEIGNLSKAQLVTECLLRNIDHSGLKSDLVTRLTNTLGVNYRVSKKLKLKTRVKWLIAHLSYIMNHLYHHK